MDADIVREIEFSRSLRGYNMAEVDAFLERMEGMFRHRDLEQENEEKKLQQQLQKNEEQAQALTALRAELEEASQQRRTMEDELRQARQALQTEKERSARCQAELEQLRTDLAAARAEAVQAEQRGRILEKSLEAQPQNRLAEVGAMAKDSLKKLSTTLRTLRK